MIGNEIQVVDPAAPSPEEKSAALRRVLGSRHFEKAVRLRDFLEYIGKHALNGSNGALHETDIGRDVYRRPADYTPAEDSIVRVEARNLRKKLEAFYSSEGDSDPIVITIPKGGYAPRFEYRDSPTAGADFSRGTSRNRAVTFALSAALVVSVAANLWHVWSTRSSATPVANNSPVVAQDQPLWSALFRNGQETYIVLPDSLYALSQDVTQTSFSLRDYQSPSFSPVDALAGAVGPSDEFTSQASWRQYTGLADSKVAARILQISSGSQAITSIRFARNMHTRDFKGRNLVLLGSSRSNPWRELFAPQLNFTFEYDGDARRPFIRNKDPRPGEQARYVAGVGRDELNDIYAAIGLVPNLTGDGYVLMIAGTSMEGTEAAGEFLLNSSAASDLFRDVVVEEDGRLRPFEILVKSSRMEGVSRGAEIVTHRVHDEL